MNSMSDCEKRLQNLQQYVPFLERMIERLSTSQDSTRDAQKQKMSSLLGVITNSGKQLRPEVLDRCEDVLRKMYKKVQGEEVHKSKDNSTPDIIILSPERNDSISDTYGLSDYRDSNRYQRNDKRGRSPIPVITVEETPRSPSPEETNRVSSSFVPRSIPIGDVRLPVSSHGRNSHADGTQSNRDLLSETGSRSLRNAPVEIPLRSQAGPSQSDFDLFVNEDRDYRQPFGRISNDRMYFDSNTGPYRGQDNPSDFSGGQPRFNDSRHPSVHERDHFLYHRNPSDIGSPSVFGIETGEFVHEQMPQQSFNQMPNRIWDDRHNRDNISLRKSDYQSRDRHYQTGKDNFYQRNHLDTPHHPNTDFSRGSRGPRYDEPHPTFRDFRGPTNQQMRTSQSMARPSNERNHWQAEDPQSALPISERNAPQGRDILSRRHPVENFRESFSHKQLSANTFSKTSGWRASNTHFDGRHDKEFIPLGRPLAGGKRPPEGNQKSSYKNCAEVEQKPKPSLLPLPGPIPNKDSVNSSLTRPITNYPTQVATSQQIGPVTPGPPTGARREDPRLKNRQMQAHPSTPSIANTDDQQIRGPTLPHQLQPRPSDPRKKSEQPNDGCGNSSKQPSKDVEGVDRETTVSSKDSRSSEEFTSPLGSLYNSSQVNQTGRGYGVQTYRIPKKKSLELICSKQGKRPQSEDQSSVTETHQGTENVLSELPPSSPSPKEPVEEEITILKDKNSVQELTEKQKNDDSDLPPIPLNVLETYLKKALPSDDAEKVLQRMRELELAKPLGTSSDASENELAQGQTSKTSQLITVNDSESETASASLSDQANTETDIVQREDHMDTAEINATTITNVRKPPGRRGRKPKRQLKKKVAVKINSRRTARKCVQNPVPVEDVIELETNTSGDIDEEEKIPPSVSENTLTPSGLPVSVEEDKRCELEQLQITCDDDDGKDMESSPKAENDSDITTKNEPAKKLSRRGRRKNDLSTLELERLHENLVDFMKNVTNLGKRRNQARITRLQAGNKDNDVPSDSEGSILNSSSRESETVPSKTNTNVRGNKSLKGKRKPLRAKVGVTAVVDISENLNKTESLVSTPAEESIQDHTPDIVESESALSNEASVDCYTVPPAADPVQSVVTGKRKKKMNNLQGKKAKLLNTKNINVSTGNVPKRNVKKRKTFLPTRLSLRGKRSMYENEELSQIETDDYNEIPASNDKYFQCKECSFLGQKIVHHYVNEHPDTEIPYITVPESEWPSIISQVSSNDPPYYIKKQLLSDLSWISSRPTFATPVVCRICSEFSSSMRSEMLEHVILHSLPADNKFQCSLCNTIENNFFEIYDHIAGHTGEYRYQCGYCGYRVARRTCIKQHMSSLHESQDCLFYHSVLPPMDQLWINGYACMTCHYVQMNEIHLQRHVKNSTCQEYRQINLVLIIDNGKDLSESASVDENNAEFKKTNGIFVCPAIEQSCSEHKKKQDEINDLAITLKSKTVSLINEIAAKLAKENNRGTQLSKEIIPENVGNSSSLVTSVKKENEDASECTYSVATKVLVSNSDQSFEKDSFPCVPLQLPDLSDTWKKPNSILATTISKLAGKLCPGSESIENIGITEEQSLDETSTSTADDVEFDSRSEEEEDDDDEEASDYFRSTRDLPDSLNITDANDMDKMENQEDTLMHHTIKQEYIDDTNVIQAIDTEEGPGFLKIESVMSLTQVGNPSTLFEQVELSEEPDIMHKKQKGNVDAVHTVRVSNVVLDKDECIFPYRVAHNRAEFAAQLKEEDIIKYMLGLVEIKNFFKCMAFRCTFNSDSAHDFSIHIKSHKKEYDTNKERIPIHYVNAKIPDCDSITIPDFYLCPYCPEGTSSPEALLNHLDLLHADCIYQCSSCFFRGRSDQHVRIHINVSHTETPARVLQCSRVLFSKNISPTQWHFKDLPKFHCTVVGCKYAAVCRESFATHLNNSHRGIAEIECYICSSKVHSIDVNFADFFSHLNTHGIGFFQCAFCHWGSELPMDVALHLCLSHPSFKGKVLVRNRRLSTLQSKTLTTYLNPYCSNVSTEEFDLDANKNHLIELCDEIETVEWETVSGEERENFENVNARRNAREKDIEFYGFGDDERAKAREQSESVLIVLDSEEEATVEDSNEENATSITIVALANEELGLPEQETPLDDSGLSGHDLYKCGNVGCDYTAETSNLLKEHLLVCDLARDSRLLTCHHCRRTLKHVSNLLEHLRIHGQKRFSCGLCGHRGPLSNHVRKHMKTTHRVNQVEVLPAGTSSVDPENGRFILYPKDMVRKLLSLRNKHGNGDGRASNVYTFREAFNIPMKSIFPYSIKCGHCGYSSKVRTNMIRHLQLHEKNIEMANGTSSEGEEIVPKLFIPDQAPVNPVPYLEGKEKMFDKMTNLAYSSHAPENQSTSGRMGGRMGLSGIEAPTSEELARMPCFVADHKRYVCGFEGCAYLTINETMLKYHLRTLHKDFTFSCPHCPETVSDVSRLSLEAFRTHLKLHGPRLYKCGHCFYYHWQRQVIERHLAEKHPNRPPWEIVIREPDDPDIKKVQEASKTEANNMPWHCSMCKQVAASCAEIHAHVKNNHGIKSQFKCAICPVRCNVRSEFERHFAARHPNQEVQVLSMYYRVENAGATSDCTSENQTESRDTKPLWNKNEARLRHIRGILLDEDTNESSIVKQEDIDLDPPDDPVYGPYGSPLNGMLCCPMCESYRVSYSRDFKEHMYRELQYKKFACSKCNVGGPSRIQIMRHAEKQHVKGGAFIREMEPNQGLEEWVEKVVKIQTAKLKKYKAISPNKAKKSITSSSIPVIKTESVTLEKATTPHSNPKAKKLVIDDIFVNNEPMETSTREPVSILPVQLKEEPIESSAVTPKVEFTCSSCPFTTTSISFFKRHEAFHNESTSNFYCRSCDFSCETELLLEEHVKLIHAAEATSPLCLQCGFAAIDRRALLTHFKKSKHTKSYQIPIEDSKATSTAEASNSFRTSTTTETSTVKKKLPITSRPYRCKYCNFRGISEAGINSHWKRCHSSSDSKPLDFILDQQPGKEVALKIIYSCLYCGFHGSFGELKEHSKELHPDLPAKMMRIKGKKRSQIPTDPLQIDGIEPPEKQFCPDVSFQTSPSTSGEKTTLSTTVAPQSARAMANTKTLFVVDQTLYVCVWCQAKFSSESDVIEHHVKHLNMALRYTRIEFQGPSKDSSICSSVATAEQNPSASLKSEMSRAVMEIRFGCPVCKKLFLSLRGAQDHVGEHTQAWKCCHSAMLFSSPVQALQHCKEAHPSLQSRIESIDSPSLVRDKLTEGITVHRLQLNMKSILKSKSSSTTITISQEEAGFHTSVASRSPTPLASSSLPALSPSSSQQLETEGTTASVQRSAVARKSTSLNSFLRDSVKMEPVDTYDKLSDFGSSSLETNLEVIKIELIDELPLFQRSSADAADNNNCMTGVLPELNSSTDATASGENVPLLSAVKIEHCADEQSE